MNEKRKSVFEIFSESCPCGCNLKFRECLDKRNRKYWESISPTYSYFFGKQHRSNQDIPYPEEIKMQEIERRLKNAEKETNAKQPCPAG